MDYCTSLIAGCCNPARCLQDRKKRPDGKPYDTYHKLKYVCTEVAAILAEILRTETLETCAGTSRSNCGRRVATEEPGTRTPNLSLSASHTCLQRLTAPSPRSFLCYGKPRATTTTVCRTILAGRFSDQRDLLQVLLYKGFDAVFCRLDKGGPPPHQ